MLANIGSSGKINKDSMDQSRVLFIDILCFLFLLLGSNKVV